MNLNKNRPIFITICGGTGSGKSTIADSLIKKLPRSLKAIVLRQDNFYKSNYHLSLEEREKINYDHPEAFDWEFIRVVVKKIVQGEKVQIPIYDFSQHIASSDFEIIENIYDVVIFEGIYSLFDKEINKISSLKIYVDTPADERFIRRLQRDILNRNRSVESVIDQWKTTVRPMYKQFIENQKQIADLIIPWYVLNNIALNAIQHAIFGLKQRN